MISPADIVRIAWEGVARNKVRSLLTMLGVIIGVAAVIIMISISAGTEAQIAAQIEGLGANLVFIQGSPGRGGFGPGGGGSNTVSLVYSDIEVIESVKGVLGTAVEQNASQNVRAGSTTLTDVSVIGTTPDFPSVRDVPLADGRFFNEDEVSRAAKVAVLGAGLAEDLFGDADPVGQTVTAGNVKVTVIGVAEPKGVVGNTDFDAQLYVPIKLVFDRFTPTQFRQFVGDQVRLIYAQVDESADISEVTSTDSAQACLA